MLLNKSLDDMAGRHEKTIITKPNESTSGMLSNCSVVGSENRCRAFRNPTSHAPNDAVELLIDREPLRRVVIGKRSHFTFAFQGRFTARLRVGPKYSVTASTYRSIAWSVALGNPCARSGLPFCGGANPFCTLAFSR